MALLLPSQGMLWLLLREVTVGLDQPIKVMTQAEVGEDLHLSTLLVEMEEMGEIAIQLGVLEEMVQVMEEMGPLPTIVLHQK